MHTRTHINQVKSQVHVSHMVTASYPWLHPSILLTSSKEFKSSSPLPFVGKQRAILYSTWKSVGETEPLKLKIKCDSVRVTRCPWFCFPPPPYPPVILFCIWLLLSWLPSQFDSSSLTRFLSSLISSFLWYKATSSFFSFFVLLVVLGVGVLTMLLLLHSSV